MTTRTDDFLTTLTKRLSNFSTLTTVTVLSAPGQKAPGASALVDKVAAKKTPEEGAKRVEAEDYVDVIRDALDIETATLVATRVNIATGDVENILPKDFFKEEQIALRAFHAQQVALGQAIMESNLKLVGGLATKLIGRDGAA